MGARLRLVCLIYCMIEYIFPPHRGPSTPQTPGPHICLMHHPKICPTNTSMQLLCIRRPLPTLRGSHARTWVVSHRTDSSESSPLRYPPLSTSSACLYPKPSSAPSPSAPLSLPRPNSHLHFRSHYSRY